MFTVALLPAAKVVTVPTFNVGVTPSAPLAPSCPLAPVSPFSPLSPFAPVSPLSPLSPLRVSLFAST